jgi:hypothetical protein
MKKGLMTTNAEFSIEKFKQVEFYKYYRIFGYLQVPWKLLNLGSSNEILVSQ